MVWPTCIGDAPAARGFHTTRLSQSSHRLAGQRPPGAAVAQEVTAARHRATRACAQAPGMM